MADREQRLREIRGLLDIKAKNVYELDLQNSCRWLLSELDQAVARRDTEWTSAVVPHWSITLTPERVAGIRERDRLKVEQRTRRERDEEWSEYLSSDVKEPPDVRPFLDELIAEAGRTTTGEVNQQLMREAEQRGAAKAHAAFVAMLDDCIRQGREFEEDEDYHETLDTVLSQLRDVVCTGGRWGNVADFSPDDGTNALAHERKLAEARGRLEEHEAICTNPPECARLASLTRKVKELEGK